MQTRASQVAPTENEKERILVENYKNHFKAMKERLKTYSSTHKNEKNANKENKCDTHNRGKQFSGVLSISHQDDRDRLGTVNQNIYKERKISPNSHVSEMNVSKSELQFPSAQEKFKFQAYQASFTFEEKMASNGESQYERQIDLSHINNDSEIEKTIKPDMQAQMALLSFRGPETGREGLLGQNASQFGVFKKVESKNIDVDYKVASSAVETPKNPNMLSVLARSPIQSPPAERIPSILAKTKKRIIIDLLQSPKVDQQSVSHTNDAETTAQVGQNQNIASESFDLEKKLEAIKTKALNDTYMQTSVESSKQQSSSAAFSKQFLIKDYPVETKYKKASEKSGSFKNRRQSTTVRHRASLMQRSSSFVRPRSRAHDDSTFSRKHSDQNFFSPKKAPDANKTRRGPRGAVTCQNSVDSARNQETPSFQKLSLSRRKQSTFTTCFVVSPSRPQLKNSSRLLEASRKGTSEFKGASRPATPKVSGTPHHRLKTKTPDKKRGRQVSALFAEQQPRVAADELLTRLARGEKAKVERVEMLSLTRKNYAKLPEVVEREKSRKAKAGLREKSRRVKEYDLVT